MWGWCRRMALRFNLRLSRKHSISCNPLIVALEIHVLDECNLVLPRGTAFLVFLFFLFGLLKGLFQLCVGGSLLAVLTCTR